MVWTVVIEPGHGRTGQGRFDAGDSAGSLIEAELTFTLALDIAEELHRAGVRTRLLTDVKQGRGLSRPEREEACPPNGLHVALHFDRPPRKRISYGRVWYRPGTPARDLALHRSIAETIDAWKSELNHAFASTGVMESLHDASLTRSDILAIVISPYSLVEQDALQYSCRLPRLGLAIGAQIARWAIAQNPACLCHAPLRAQKETATGQSARPYHEMMARPGKEGDAAPYGTWFRGRSSGSDLPPEA